MKRIVDHLGAGSAAILAVTLVLFVLALFLKGFSKELLIEAAVFLVSVKIILATYRNSMESKAILKRLDSIEGLLRNGQARGQDKAP
jgi:hypothetical protein